MRHAKELIFALIALLAAAAALFPPWGLAPDQGAILGVALLTLGFWGTGLIPNFLAALLMFALFIIPGLATPETVFSGFATPAMWIVTAGFVIGAAIRGSGLGGRLAGAAAPHLGRSHAALIAGLMILGALLGFLMPSSMGRASVLAPLAVALAEGMGYGPGSRGKLGVAAAVALGSNLPSFAILPANVPNLVLTGAAERLWGVEFGYAEYLALHYPVLGVLKTALATGLILHFFPASPRPQTAPGPAPAPAGRQKLLLGVLLVTLGFWATDALHGVNPAWVGLAAAVVLLWPRIGFVTPEAFRSAADFPTLLFTAGAICLGAVMAQSGVGAALAGRAAAALPLAPGADFLNFMSLSALGAVTAMATTLPGVPAILTPMAGTLAEAAGWKLEAALMIQVIGFSTVALPYQAPPLIVAMGLMGESLRPLVKLLLSLWALSFLVLIPLDFLWWKLLGWI